MRDEMEEEVEMTIVCLLIFTNWLQQNKSMATATVMTMAASVMVVASSTAVQY